MTQRIQFEGLGGLYNLVVKNNKSTIDFYIGGWVTLTPDEALELRDFLDSQLEVKTVTPVTIKG